MQIKNNNFNFVGVFPADKINNINFKQMIHEKTAKHLFLIGNREDSSKEGRHWQSILDIEPKENLFFFDFFGIEGLKNFIITDDKQVTPWH